MYNNHPMGTRSKSDLRSNRGARMRWAPRLSDGKDHPVTVTRIDRSK